MSEENSTPQDTVESEAELEKEKEIPVENHEVPVQEPEIPIVAGIDQVGDDQNSYPSPGQHGGQSSFMLPPQNPRVTRESFVITTKVCKIKPTQRQFHQSGRDISPPL
jgi:hypothetical protein